MVSVLVTGGAGFIGSATVKELLLRGYDVSVYDSRPDIDSLNDLMEAVKVINGDIRDFKKLSQAISSAEGVIHLAAVSRVIWGFENPLECVDVNVKGTANVLEAARRAKKRPWVIFGSSREIYGEPEALPVPESAPKSGINVYGVTKISGESLCERYHKNYGLNIGVLRFSNVYGGIFDILDRVIPKFIIRSLQGNAVVIQGGEQLFDFTYITDTADGIMKMVKKLSNSNTSEKKYFDDFHVLTGRPTSLQDVVSLIQKNLDRDIKVAYDSPRHYDVQKFYGDPSKARDLLGFSAKTDIEEGIKRTVALFEERIKSQDITPAKRPAESKYRNKRWNE